MGYLVGLPFLVVLWAVAAVYHGLVLAVMWGWFIVPLGGPPINVAWAIGLANVVAFTTRDPQFIRDEFKQPARQRLIASLVWPLIVLAVGYVAKQYM